MVPQPRASPADPCRLAGFLPRGHAGREFRNDTQTAMARPSLQSGSLSGFGRLRHSLDRLLTDNLQRVGELQPTVERVGLPRLVGHLAGDGVRSEVELEAQSCPSSFHKANVSRL